MSVALEQAREALAEGDVQAFSVADLDFHRAVIEAVGNDFVPALLVPIDAALYEIRLQTSRDVRAGRRALVMHGRVYDAIRRRAATDAEDAMRQHLDETRRNIARMTE
jgi:DNA-binding FadR family transcriptional regulator